jgi:FKBP-type peptidyl-prolyl cis-trans isomerase FkpA
MKISQTIVAIALATSISACSNQDSDTNSSSEATAAADVVEEQTVSEESATATESFEIAPGLSAKVMKNGYGRVAEAGDYVEVHYTGWLYDEAAADNRGNKFDSSVDRGEKFNFRLGAGQVIKGWDQGVAGMLIGEKRELTLAPEMGYGQRGAGNVIPPGATLVFEVELFGLEGPGDSN